MAVGLGELSPWICLGVTASDFRPYWSRYNVNLNLLMAHYRLSKPLWLLRYKTAKSPLKTISTSTLQGQEDMHYLVSFLGFSNTKTSDKIDWIFAQTHADRFKIGKKKKIISQYDHLCLGFEKELFLLTCRCRFQLWPLTKAVFKLALGHLNVTKKPSFI